MYFYLDNNCFFIPGKCKGALYDTLKNEVYTLENDEAELLKISENGYEVDNLDKDFFYQLEDMKLGFFSQNKCFVEKNKIYNTYLSEERYLFPLEVYSLYIKLNNTCPGNCKFCNRIQCPVCTCTYEENKELKADKWMEVIDYLSKIKLQEIYFTGGDPLLYKDLVKLINYTKNKNIDPIIITSGLSHLPENLPLDTTIIITLFEDRDINSLFKKFNKFNKILVFCSDEKTAVDIEDLNYENVTPYKFNLDNIIDCVEELKPITLEKIYYKRYCDNCLMGKMYIDNLGNVVPCYKGLNDKIGNIIFNDKNTVLKNLIDNIWYKPSINSKCSNCELYFSCTTCRYYDSYNNCKYDVENGIWEN